MFRRTVPGLLLCLALTTAWAGADDEWTTFEFEAYNREYVNIRSNARWTRQGPIQATLSSPAHRLSIRDHSVDLRPSTAGSYEARIRVNFSGEGDVFAELEMAGAETKLEDHVVAPRQEVEVMARIRFRQVDGGYEVETLELPPSVEVEIESRLGEQIIGVCQSALVLLGVQCGGLDEMFSSATIPLPKAGGTYFISEEQLTPAERVRLNRFLEG